MSTQSRVGIYGAGNWGLAIDFILSRNCKTLISSRTPRDLPNFVSLDEVLDSEYIVLAIGAQNIRGFFESHAFRPDQKFLVASKGIDCNSYEFLDDICLKHIGFNQMAFLTGPSFASEVMDSKMTTLCVASFDEALAQSFKDFLKAPFLRTYISKDVKGCEIAGAYKNVIAIASGIACGLELGNNATAALIARGLVEIHRFGEFFGAKTETFLDISGVGDLVLTATNKLSRNYQLGLLLSEGIGLQKALQQIGQVVEGVGTTRAIVHLSKKHHIYTPIAQVLFDILNGREIEEGIQTLMR